MNDRFRIAVALETAVRWSQFDGSHHKAWAIDQMVRALCPGDEYDKFIARACDGEDGPDTYSWDEGIPP